MRTRRSTLRSTLPVAPGLVVLLALTGCGGAPSAEGAGGGAQEAALQPILHETERDWEIVRETLTWGFAEELHLLPIGEVISAFGARFVGTPYEPGTLEAPGPEGLVLNLRAFDCVTLVEHLLVLSRITRAPGGPALLADESALRARYRSELIGVRYRDGVLAGYPSRLHYFSDWLRDAGAKGIAREITGELGAVPDPRPIHFMSSNPASYRQIAEDPANLTAIRAQEEELNALPRLFIPQDRIAAVEGGIQNGDLIAAVSTVAGLDIAHTGVAHWREGRLHLLHAPLVGDSVEISERPLAERILGIAGQQGIVVSRPLEPRR